MLHATIDNPFPLQGWEVRSFMVRAQKDVIVRGKRIGQVCFAHDVSHLR